MPFAKVNLLTLCQQDDVEMTTLDTKGKWMCRDLDLLLEFQMRCICDDLKFNQEIPEVELGMI
jgi:hypothetical protein